MSSENKRQSEEQPLNELVSKILKAYGLQDKMKNYDLIAA